MRHLSLIGLSILGALGVGCSKRSTTSSSTAGSLLIPSISGPVGTWSAALAAQVASGVFAGTGTAATGVSFSDSFCGGGMGACNSALDQVWSMTNSFLTAGKGADLYGCMVQAMANNSIVPNLTDGEYHYAGDDEMGMKIKVVATDDVLESYEMFLCSSSTQVGYVDATLTGTSVAFLMKSIQSGMGFSIDASGEYSDGAWLSKSMTFLADMTGLGKMKGSITQYSDYVDIQGTSDTSTTDFQFYSRAQLLGSSPATYALGDGSAKAALDSVDLAGSPVSWLGDSPASVMGTAANGAFYADVTSGSYHALPLSDTVTFGTAETWDCESSADATNFMTAAAGNTGFQTAIQACVDAFQ